MRYLGVFIALWIGFFVSSMLPEMGSATAIASDAPSFFYYHTGKFSALTVVTFAWAIAYARTYYKRHLAWYAVVGVFVFINTITTGRWPSIEMVLFMMGLPKVTCKPFLAAVAIGALLPTIANAFKKLNA